jgi:hypothetical protein
MDRLATRTDFRSCIPIDFFLRSLLIATVLAALYMVDSSLNLSLTSLRRFSRSLNSFNNDAASAATNGVAQFKLDHYYYYNG